MSEPRTSTGPVSLPADPKAVADQHVHDLASLGTLRKPPTAREYEHAALDIALDGAPDEHLYAVLAHLEIPALRRLSDAAMFLGSGVEHAIADRTTGTERG